MAADSWKVFDVAKEAIGDNTIDLDDASAGIYKCGLIIGTATSVIQTAATWTDIIDTSYECTTGGYTANGEALTTVIWTSSGGTVTWNSDDIAWTASGTTLEARWAVIYHVASDIPIAMCLMDNTPQDINVTVGNTLTLTSASGMFTMSGGWA